jgi:hypothetical protein
VSRHAGTCNNTSDGDLAVVFGIKSRAEMNLSDEEYRRGRRIFFKLKWRVFVQDLVIMWVGATALVGILSGFAWILALIQGGYLDWTKLLKLTLVVPPVPAILFSVWRFLFHPPFDIPPETRNAKQQDN